MRCRDTDAVITSRSVSPAPAGYRFPREVIAVAVRWYLRYGLSYRDVEELLAERGINVDHVTIYRWVQTCTAEFIDAARAARHASGDRWFVDETYLKVAGRWAYLYRAVDQHGQVIDVLLCGRRDAAAARAFFSRALRCGPAPVEVVTDRAPLPASRERASAGGTACHRAVRKQRHRNRSRPTQGEAAPDARAQTPGIGAHHRCRARLRAEPAPRPLRAHQRPARAGSGPHRVRGARPVPLTAATATAIHHRRALPSLNATPPLKGVGPEMADSMRRNVALRTLP
jgi:transposase, IS6 family